MSAGAAWLVVKRLLDRRRAEEQQRAQDAQEAEALGRAHDAAVDAVKRIINRKNTP